MNKSTPVDYLTFYESLFKLDVKGKTREFSYDIYSIICAGQENPTNKLISKICDKKEETLKKHIPLILDKAIFLNKKECKTSRNLISFFPTNTTAIAKLIYVKPQDKYAIFQWRIPKVETLLEIHCVFSEEYFSQIIHLIPNEYYYFNYSSLQIINLYNFKATNPRDFITIDKLNLSICDRTGVPSLINPNLEL